MFLRKFLIGTGLLLTDIVLLCCCLYLTVLADRMESITPNYLLWIVLSLAGFFVNLIIASKKSALALLVLWTMSWMALTAIVTALTFNCAPPSIPFRIFVCAVLVIIQGHGLSITLLPQRTDTQLTFLDILIVVFTIFLAASQAKVLGNVIALQLLGFLALGYMFVSLIFLRTSSAVGTIVQGDHISSRLKVFGALGGIVAGSCIFCAALSLMASNSIHTVFELLQLLGANAKVLLKKVGNAASILFSRIPQGEGDSAPIGSSSSAVQTAEETGSQAIQRLPDWILPCAGILVLLLIILLLIRFIWKLRKNKLTFRSEHRISSQLTIVKTAKKNPPLLSKWRQHLLLKWTIFQNRKTTEGLVLYLKKAGGALGVKMAPSDSWHGYTTRLMPYGDETILKELADYLQSYFYSPAPRVLSQKQYRHFKAALNQLKKERKATSNSVPSE